MCQQHAQAAPGSAHSAHAAHHTSPCRAPARLPRPCRASLSSRCRLPRAPCAPSANTPIAHRPTPACAPRERLPPARPAPARALPARPAPCHGLACRVMALCCNTVQQPIASAVTIQFFYCDTIFLQPFSCNTILQYTSLHPAFSCNTINCIAIQFSSSQTAQVTIQMLYCNTNL